jgi:hypothetical protein
VKANFLKGRFHRTAVVALVLSVTSSLNAQESFLMQAAKAWEGAELNKAADMYEKALEQGGLYPSDVLVAYSRIGTVRAASGRANEALSRFRVAVTLDPSFELPSEAGPRAKQIYKKAKAEAAKQGGKLEVTAEVPEQATPGTDFKVTAHIPEPFVPLMVEMGITVSDPSIATMQPWSAKKPVDASVQFDVPGKVVLSGANLLVRVDALDSHGNRWASSQTRVRVNSPKAKDQGAMAAGPLPEFGDDDKDKKKGGGFWSSPWPWVIGGAVVVGGTAAYFMTRPTDQVTVSAPQWH